MALKIGKALSKFDLADEVDLNCGDFDLRCRQAAVHNEDFRAAVTQRAQRVRRKTLVPTQGTLTGSFEEDVALFCEKVILGWGERPLKDDDGKVVKWTKEVGMELFGAVAHPDSDPAVVRQGKVLFGKVMQGTTSDDLFIVREEDLGN